jgi:hypothetical protein
VSRDGTSVTRDQVLEDMATGLTDRGRNLLRALDRQDRLETAQEFIGWLPRQVADARLAASTQELMLRALAVSGDPINFELLTRLDPLVGLEVPELMAEVGLGRVAVSERVNDLLQVGLATRDMVSDQIRGTALGAGLVALVREVAAASAARLAAELEVEGPRVDG